MAVKTVSLDHVADATEKLVALFESGNLPKAMAPLMIRPKDGDGAVPSAQWSLGNQLLMILGGTEDARGFRQWEAVGRHVVKGAKAIWILAPMTRKIRETDAETGETRERVIVTGFKGIPVFRVEDTDGAELPAAQAYRPTVAMPLQDVATAWGYRITYGPARDGSCYAWTNHGSREIHMMTEDPATFLHELGHAADERHYPRTPDMRGQQADREMTAEMTGAVLALMLGLPVDGRTAWSRSYVEGYAHAAKKSLAAGMMAMLTRVQKAVGEVVQEAETLQLAVSQTA